MENGDRNSTALEDTAIGVLRRARATCEHMGQTGIRLAAMADWLEFQVPLVGDRCRRVVQAVLAEASGQGPDERK